MVFTNRPIAMTMRLNLKSTVRRESYIRRIASIFCYVYILFTEALKLATVAARVHPDRVNLNLNAH